MRATTSATLAEVGTGRSTSITACAVRVLRSGSVTRAISACCAVPAMPGSTEPLAQQRGEGVSNPRVSSSYPVAPIGRLTPAASGNESCATSGPSSYKMLVARLRGGSGRGSSVHNLNNQIVPTFAPSLALTKYVIPAYNSVGLRCNRRRAKIRPRYGSNKRHRSWFGLFYHRWSVR